MTISLRRLMFFFMAALLTLSLSACVNVQKAQHEKKIDNAVTSHVQAAMKYLQLDKPNGAKRHLAKAQELRPKSALVQNGLALFYRYLQNPEKEEEHLRKALDYNKHYAAAHNNYGIMLSDQKRYKEAIEQFTAAAKNLDNRRSGLAYANLGRCYQEVGNEKKALWAYKKAILLKSADAGIFLKVANIYFKQKDYATSRHYYQHYTKIQNPQRAAGLWLGIRLADQANNKNARSSYELALKNLYPQSAQYKTWQAWSQAHGGD